MAIDIQWILDDASLARHCAEWRKLPYVALDTEFMRVDTFYPIAGLLQVGDGQRAYLVDPLVVKDWAPFAELLEDPAVTKVLHSCSEDLEVFLKLLPRSSTGERMNPYTSLWTGVTDGDGPQDLHVVLLDNGRSRVLSDPTGRAALRWSRCPCRARFMSYC